MYSRGIHFEPHAQHDGTILLDVKDDVLGHIGRIVVATSQNGAAHIQIQMHVVENASVDERAARMKAVAEEIAARFNREDAASARH